MPVPTGTDSMQEREAPDGTQPPYPRRRHRVLLGFEAESEGVAVADLLPVWQQAAWRRVG